MWRPTIVSIPEDRHAIRIIEFYLSSLLTTIMKIIIAVLRKINVGFVNMWRSRGNSCYFNRKCIPAGIIWNNVNEENTAYAIWVLSQHSVLQSISKNTIPFASSVHINISINIDITGIYSINPTPWHIRSFIKYTISLLDTGICKMIRVTIVIPRIPYVIYIYIYIISSVKSIKLIGYNENFYTMSVDS